MVQVLVIPWTTRPPTLLLEYTTPAHLLIKHNTAHHTPHHTKTNTTKIITYNLNPITLTTNRTNTKLNNMTLNYSKNFFTKTNHYNLILITNILYNHTNLPLLDHFLNHNHQTLITNSQIKNFQHPLYQHLTLLNNYT